MATKVITVLECIECGAELEIPTRSIREAARYAEEHHQWSATGHAGMSDFACPLPEVPCTRCLRPAPAEVEIAARQRSRPWRKG